MILSNLISFKDHVIINLIGLEKTSRPGNIRGHICIQNFTDDASLCPMDALTEYFERVSPLDLYFRFENIYFYRPSSFVMTVHHSSFLIMFLTNQLPPNPCQDGSLISSTWLVSTPLLSSLMPRGLPPVYFTANH